MSFGSVSEQGTHSKFIALHFRGYACCKDPCLVSKEALIKTRVYHCFTLCNWPSSLVVSISFLIGFKVSFRVSGRVSRLKIARVLPLFWPSGSTFQDVGCKKPFIHLCDFAKRCLLRFRLNTGIASVQASVARKKSGGLASCWVSAESPGPDLSVGGWLPYFVWKPVGVGREDFVTLIRVLCQKAVQSQRINFFPVA